jgi:hypothetical protein
MTARKTSFQMTSDLSGRQMFLNLAIQENGRVFVRSCEIVGPKFRTRTSFHDLNDIDDILMPQLANTVKECLADIPEGSQVVSLPELFVEMPGLVLSSAHVLVMTVNDGVRHAIVRFKEFIGAVNRAFLPQIGFQDSILTYNERLATNVLREVCLPILNMCRELEFMDKHSSNFPQRLAERSNEFEFQTELLKRYIRSNSPADMEEHQRLAANRTPRIENDSEN